MARLAALFDHEEATHRYGSWAFLVDEEKGEVLLLARLPDRDDPDCPTETLGGRWGVKLLCEECGADGKPCECCSGSGYEEVPHTEVTDDSLLYEWGHTGYE